MDEAVYVVVMVAVVVEYECRLRVQRFTVKTVLYARFPSIMPKFVTSAERSHETRAVESARTNFEKRAIGN